KGEIPKAQRESAHLVVDEQARQVAPQPDAAGSAPAAPPPAAEPPHQAQVVYDPERLSEVYLAGLQRGLDAARSLTTGGGVQINAPLVAAGGGSTVALPYDYAPYYYPFVTTSFDRGRS